MGRRAESQVAEAPWKGECGGGGLSAGLESLGFTCGAEATGGRELQLAAQYSVLWRHWPGGGGGLEEKGKEGCQALGGRVAGEWEEMDGLDSSSLSGGMWVSHFSFVTFLLNSF